MRRGLGNLSLVLLLAGCLAAVSAQDKKDEKKDDKKPDAQGKQAVTKALEKAHKPGTPLLGRIVRMDEAEETIAVEITLQIPQINQGAVQRTAQIQVEMAQAQAKRDINQIRNLASELSRQQQVTYREEKRTIEFEMADDLKVRTMVLGPEFNEKGKARRLTDKEKRDLKGPDPRLRGYVADVSNLQTEQIVEVYVVPVKATPKAKIAATPKTKSKSDPKSEKTKGEVKGESGDDEEVVRPKISMIVIRSEPAK